MFIEELVTNIDARIAALQSEIQPLLNARAALVTGSPAPARTKQPQRKAAAVGAPVAAGPDATTETPKPIQKRTPRTSAAGRKADPVPAGKLTTLLQGSAGLTAAALAKQAGGNVTQVRVLLKGLAEAGEVRRTGERRGTRWHLITDEDRIAERAGQLEAQSIAHASRSAEPIVAGVAG